MPGDERPASLEEVAARAHNEERVRSEYAARDEAMRNGERDRAVVALAISVTFAAVFLIPAWAAIIAFSCRVFRWVLWHPINLPW